MIHPGAGRLHLRRRDRPAREPGGQAGLSPHQAALFPRGHRALRSAHHRQQRGDDVQPPLDRASTAGTPSPPSARAARRAPSIFALSGPRQAAGQLRAGDGPRPPSATSCTTPVSAAASATTTSSRPSFPGGASSPWLGPEHLDLPLTRTRSSPQRDHARAPVRSSPWTTRPAWCGRPGASPGFFHRESCGQCTPCREGSGWLEKILERIEARPGPRVRPGPAAGCLRQHLSRRDLAPGQTTICPLGPSMPPAVAVGHPHVPGRVPAHVARHALPTGPLPRRLPVSARRARSEPVRAHDRDGVGIDPRTAGDGPSVTITIDGRQRGPPASGSSPRPSGPASTSPASATTRA